jgi:8-oxo-dGTP diphosphatase
MVNVVGGIIRKEQKILICRRSTKEPMSGFWEFPGGKIEYGETKKEALKRELQEELEIASKVGSLISNYVFNYSEKSFNLFFYNISSFNGKIKKRVHDKIIWENKENFRNYKFLPGDIPFIDYLLKLK